MKAGRVKVAALVTGLVVSELIALLLVGIGIGLMAAGHGVGLFFVFGLGACVVAPILGGIAFAGRRKAFFAALALWDLSMIVFAMVSIFSDRRMFSDFVRLAYGAVTEWVALLGVLHASLIVMALLIQSTKKPAPGRDASRASTSSTARLRIPRS